MGIRVHTVIQPVDDDTPQGKLFRIISMAFGEFDNILRRQKTVAGTVTRLRKGKYCGVAPFGYENITRSGEKMIVPTKEAKFVRAAFEMKAYERLSNQEIINRLHAMGCRKVYKQRLTDWFRNPIYCGLIRHKQLNGEVVQGVHEPIISKEIFLLTNELQLSNPQGWRQDPENDAVPLKRFLRCKKCEKPMTGYLVKSKGLYYYKCNTKGCKVNRSAKQMNGDFREIMQHLVLLENYRTIARDELLAVVQDAEKDKSKRRKMLIGNRRGIENKLERLEERFIDEEIDKPMFEKHRERYRLSIREIDHEIEKAGEVLSNRSELVGFATEIGANLARLWDSGVYALCQKVQEMVFPQGIFYNKETDRYRTPALNSIFALFVQISQKILQKKNGQLHQFGKLSVCVAGTGLEPVTFGL